MFNLNMRLEMKQAGGRSYGRKADIWSLGAAVVEMVTGKPPFHNLAPVTALFRIGSSSALPEIPSSLSPQGKDFLSLCFRRDVSMRPNAAELLQHPWITEIDESSSPTITNTYDTKTLAFQHETSSVIHAIGAPAPVPMPKNPKMFQAGTNGGNAATFIDKQVSAAAGLSNDVSSLQLQPVSSSHSMVTYSASESATVAASSSSAHGSSKSKRKDKEKSPRSSRPKSSKSQSSPRSDSEGGGKSPTSKSKRKSVQTTPAAATNPPPPEVEEEENDEEDAFGSILNFVSTRAHAE